MQTTAYNLEPTWYKKTSVNKRPTSVVTQAGAQPTSDAAPVAQPAATAPYVAPTPATTAAPGEYWQNAINLSRRANQGGWAAGAESLKRDLGGAGFRAGESGIADSALGQFYSQGAEKMGQNATQLAVEKAKTDFMNNFDLDQLNFAKSKWGQEFGASREDQAMQDMLAYMAIMQQNQAAPYAAYWGGLNSAINS